MFLFHHKLDISLHVTFSITLVTLPSGKKVSKKKYESIQRLKDKKKDKSTNNNEPIVIAQSSFQGTTSPVDVHVNGL